MRTPTPTEQWLLDLAAANRVRGPMPERPGRGVWILAAAWMLLIGFVLGGVLFPRVSDRPSLEPAAVHVALQPTTTATRPPTAPARAERYSWPPAPHASAYRVVVYSGARVVLSKSVRGNSATLRLDPGNYRWLVFADGSSRAIISSTLTVR